MSVLLTSVPAVPGTVPPEVRAQYDRARMAYDTNANDAALLRREFAAAMFRLDGIALWGIAKVAEARGIAPEVVSTYLRMFALLGVTQANPDTVVAEASASQINLLIPLVQARQRDPRLEDELATYRHYVEAVRTALAEAHNAKPPRREAPRPKQRPARPAMHGTPALIIAFPQSLKRRATRKKEAL